MFQKVSHYPFIYKSLFMIAYDGNSRPRQYYLNILIISSSLFLSLSFDFIFCQHSYIKNASIVKAKKKTLLLFFPTTAIKKTFALLLSSLYVHYECTSEKNKEGREGGVAAQEKNVLIAVHFILIVHAQKEQEKSFHLLLADTVDCSKTIACYFSIFLCQKIVQMSCPHLVNLLSASQEKVDR